MPIDIVCTGWDALSDAAEFYPEDLPADWRLGYFANTFDAVYLPAKHWAERSEQVLAQWSEDVHDGFCFHLEAPSTAAAEPIERARRALGDRLAGIVVDSADPTSRPDAGVRCWRRVADLDGLAGLDDAVSAQVGGLALHLSALPDDPPRDTRRRLERLRGQCGSLPLLAVLEPPCAGTLLRWRTIVELLGWP